MSAQAADLRTLTVTSDQGRYVLESETYMAASRAASFQVLMDYDRFTEISSVYKQSRYLEPESDGTPRVYTLAKGCLLFVCRDVEKVERLSVVEQDQRIVAEVVPELSNLEESVTEWRLEREGEGTRLFYRMELVPKFWIPPLIGPPIIRYALAKGGEQAVQRLEALAQARESSLESSSSEPRD